MSEERKGLTRRSFLEMVGLAGGAAAVYEVSEALGLVRPPEAWAGPPRLEVGSGAGRSVLVLGAGIGGLTATYELLRAGYDVTVLEAQDRLGGRSLTARAGSVIHEQSAEHGATEQTCSFDEGLYLNMGPGRLPYHHRRVLHYCHDLGVPLEIYVMTTTANLFQTDESFGGSAPPRRQILADTRGYISELLAKSVRSFDLDAHLDAEDSDRLLSLLRVFGDLDDRWRYTGSTRAGCRFPLSVHEACKPSCPLALDDLLNSEFWEHRFYQPDDYEWQPTLFQPVGGMDKIVDGFRRGIERVASKPVDRVLRRGVEVTEIRLFENGVEVSYRNRGTGETGTARADYCVSNVPLPILSRIPAGFSPDFQAAVDHAVFAPTCKVGWQAEERFWESDRYEIYGGISFIDHLITQMWYPSDGYFGAKGTLTGTYNFSSNAVRMGKMSLPERLRAARQGAIRLHKEFEDPALVPERLGLSIAWQNVPFQEGGWAEWTNTPEDRTAYARLLAPDGRFHVVGDQVSPLPGWQEGAMMSAEHVIEQIAGIRPLTVPEIDQAPETRRLVEGLY